MNTILLNSDYKCLDQLNIHDKCPKAFLKVYVFL